MAEQKQRSKKEEAAAAAVVILALESLSKSTLKSAVALAAYNASNMGVSVAVAGVMIAHLAQAAIDASRREARRRAAEAFTRQTGLGATASVDIEYTYVAGGLRKAFVDSASEASETLGERAAIRAAIAEIEPSIYRTATTEVVEAWNDETKAQAEEARALDDGGNLDQVKPRIVFTWVADLDRKTCPACAELDGTHGIGEGAFGGEWPPLHPNCRCFILSTYEH